MIQTKSTMIWHLKANDLFEGGTDSVLSWAAREVREIEFKKGDALALKDDESQYVFSVLEGSVKLSTTNENGKETILDVAGPGDIFGPIEKLIEQPTRHSELQSFASEATALGKGVAVCFELSRFRSMVENRPYLMFNISRLLGLQSTRLQLRLSRLLYRSSLGKVAGLISELAERYGEESPEGFHTINFKLTHQEMASMTGLKRETVSEALGILELEEYIRTEKRQITVLRLDELENVQ